MAKKKQKILILDYDSDTTAAVRDIFSKHYDAVTVASLETAAKKANAEKFDIIITGYVIPAVSGEKAISYLKNIKNAISKVEKVAKDKSAAAKKLLRKSQDKQDEILNMLNENIRGVENERAVLEKKIQSMMGVINTARNSKTEAEKKAEAALKGKQEAEKKAEAALKDKQKSEEKAETVLMEKTKMEEEFGKLREEDVKVIDKLNNEVNTLKEEIENSASLAEEAYKEKAEIEEKLKTLQENWEKYVAG